MRNSGLQVLGQIQVQPPLPSRERQAVERAQDHWVVCREGCCLLLDPVGTAERDDIVESMWLVHEHVREKRIGAVRGLVVVEDERGELFTVKASTKVTSQRLATATDAAERLAPVTYLDKWREG